VSGSESEGEEGGEGDQNLVSRGARLEAATGPAAAYLKPYQLVGINFLLLLYRQQVRGARFGQGGGWRLGGGLGGEGGSGVRVIRQQNRQPPPTANLEDEDDRPLAVPFIFGSYTLTPHQ